MAFVDRVVEHPNRIKLTAVEGESDTYDLTRAEGEVTEEGTPLNADNLNAQIQEAINNAISRLNNAITVDSNNNVVYRNMQSGRALVKPTKAKAVTAVNVKFPRAFTKVPNVVVTPWTGGPNIISASAGNITTTGFTIYMYRTTKVNTTVMWHAHI